jgi:hypothetical protein
MDGVFGNPAPAAQGTPRPAGSTRAFAAAASLGAVVVALVASTLFAIASARHAGAAAARRAAPPATQFVLSKGTVESIRELPTQADGRHFEMIIRMRDGSMRVTDERSEGRWQAGDGVRLITEAPAAVVRTH